MKKIIIVAVILVTISSVALANTVEFDQAGEKQQIQLYVTRPISGRVGGYVYSCQSKGWGEIHIGLTYAVSDNMSISAGIGKETAGNRVASSIWAGKGKFSGIYFLEKGPHGNWDKLVIKYQTSKVLAIGWTKKKFAGQAIYADFKLTKEVTVKYSGFKEPEIALMVSF